MPPFDLSCNTNTFIVITCTIRGLQSPRRGYIMYPPSKACGLYLENRCYQGYRMSGSPRRWCQPDGRWNGTIPICEGLY